MIENTQHIEHTEHIEHIEQSEHIKHTEHIGPIAHLGMKITHHDHTEGASTGTRCQTAPLVQPPCPSVAGQYAGEWRYHTAGTREVHLDVLQKQGYRML